MTCALCGCQVDPRLAYQRVAGWEKPGRGTGGRSGSSLVLREHIGDLACSECIARLTHGFDVHAKQGSLL